MSLADIVRPHGRHRAVDEVARLRTLNLSLLVLLWHLMRRLVEATAARDAANAKVSFLGEVAAQAAEATQRADRLEAEVIALRAQLANNRKAGSLAAHPAVTDTQWIPVLTLPDAAAKGALR
ncbi:hypothetical protein [Streptomyces sp. NPDC001194]|uniref:hypothetical protein n=1 Tax=Streptomyces sp. NPDC001194 TaxID=3364547 RepID=UPI003691CD91